MTRHSYGTLALALLVTACGPERTEPSEPVVVRRTDANVASATPFFSQPTPLFAIVDEAGIPITQPLTGDDPTQGWIQFRLADTQCRRTSWPEPALEDDPSAPFVVCGTNGIYIVADVNPAANSDLCLAAPLPRLFAAFTYVETCRRLTRVWTFSSPFTDRTSLFVRAAPTAPGNREFDRWEVTGAPPCINGDVQLTCITSVSEAQFPALFVKAHYRRFFQPPVNAWPVQNVVQAGRAVPIKFSLGGYRGLDIFAPRSPEEQLITCTDGSPVVPFTYETVTAGQSGLSYDSSSDTYTYVWKTDRSWAGTCSDFIIRLRDGSLPKRVRFRF